MLIVKRKEKDKIPGMGKGVEKLESWCMWECKMRESRMAAPALKTESPRDPAIPLLGTYQSETKQKPKTHASTDLKRYLCIMFIVALLYTIAYRQKQHKCAFMDEWTHKM